MSKTMASCEKCDWKKEYPNPNKARLGLNLHVMRKHRRIPKQQPKYSMETFQVNFCPGCGYNLQFINRASIMAQKFAS